MKKTYAVTLLRMLIGWHFLYEGLYKLVQPGGWSAEGYLRTSQWFAAPLFHQMAATPWLLKAVDLMNMWGLTLIGVALIVGLLVRPAAAAGFVLLLFYFVAQPPFLSPSADGHFLWIDRNVVEAAALLAVMLVPSYSLGSFLAALPRKLFKRRLRSDNKSDEEDVPVASPERRELLLSLSSLPVIGAFGYAFFKKHGPVWERKNLEAKPDAVTTATVKSFDFTDIKDLKKPLDKYGQIGNLKLSRMFLGGNLIGGWAHARDLIYVDKLVKAYHSDWRVFRTFRMAEQCGMNAILCNPQLGRVINDYWKREGGRIQYISDCGHKDGPMEGIRRSLEGGAHSCYIQGEISDRYVRDGKFKELEESLAFIRKQGLPAGIGAHKLETVKGCVERGIVPDYWVKTIHRTDYWSARLEGPRRDNIWCENPEETAAFMEKLEQPWIGFKILAAGAIQPQVGFPFAFKNGADFICVGMYDFQLVDNVNLVNTVLDAKIDRKRPWRA
jgi:uncharacterized membrane protein YphA (DoxX/SURF4 family)